MNWVIREISQDDLTAWGKAINLGYMRHFRGSDTEWRKSHFVAGRSLGVYENGECIGTLRSAPTKITVPGGADVSTDIVSNVTVHPEHRRQGILTHMIDSALRRAHERGEALSSLCPSVYGLYERYGYGPATQRCGVEIDILRSGGLREPVAAPVGRVRLLSMEEAREVGPMLHEQWRHTRPGIVERAPNWWQIATGSLRHPATAEHEPFVAGFEDERGRIRGIFFYNVRSDEDRTGPYSVVEVIDHMALGSDASHALWTHVFTLDWARAVRIRNIADDDPLFLMLRDPRAVHTSAKPGDGIWLRVLDLPTALEARSYQMSGEVILGVSDRLGFVQGNWRLAVSSDYKPSVNQTEDSAHLKLDVGALASLYMGVSTASCLAEAGRLTVLQEDAVGLLDSMIVTSRRSWCPDSV